jgi:hypothetical protein
MIRSMRLRITPRADRGLVTDTLNDLSGVEIEAAYLGSDPMQHAVIDDFLAPAAFRELHDFLLQDSGWSFNRAQAQSLYLPRPNAPQAADIANSLCRQIPRVLAGFELVEHWAFLHPRSGGLRPHFDVGSVTVNLWMTHDSHNRTPERSGLILYGVKRPTELQADEYKRPGWADDYFKREHDGTEVSIAYRCNRAVLFNSALFHASDEGVFEASDLESSRMNLTFLFDDRHSYDTRRDRFGYA